MHVCHDPEWLASQSYTVNFVPLNSTENTDFWKTVPMYFYVYLVMDLISRGRYPVPLGTDKTRKTDYSCSLWGRVRWRSPRSFWMLCSNKSDFVRLHWKLGEAGGRTGCWVPWKQLFSWTSELRMLPSGRGGNVATFFATYCDPLIVICQTWLWLARTAHKGEQLPVLLWL